MSEKMPIALVGLGGRPETFMGLAGAGDLILTCTGELSRNRRVGLLLAQGHDLERVLAQLGHVSEGVASAKAVQKMALGLQVVNVVQYVALQRWPIAISNISFSLVVILDLTLCHKAQQAVMTIFHVFLVSKIYNVRYWQQVLI